MPSPALRPALATASPEFCRPARRGDGETRRNVGCRHPQNPVYGGCMAVGSTSMHDLSRCNSTSRTDFGAAVPLQRAGCSTSTDFPAPVFRCGAEMFRRNYYRTTCLPG